MPRIRVATWNLRFDRPADGPDQWPHRRSALVDHVRRISPCVLATQEGLLRQLDYIGKELGGGGGSKEEGGWERVGSCRTPSADDEHCAIFVRRSGSRRVMSSGNFWLSEKPEEPGSVGWDAQLPRVATWCVLGEADNTGSSNDADSTTGGGGATESGSETPVPRPVLAVVNCHFDHRGATARLESARLVAARARSISAAHGNVPVVLCGDFNAEKIGEPVFAQLRAEGWADAFDRVIVPPGGKSDTTLSGNLIDLGTCRGSTFHAFKGPAEANDASTWSPEAQAALGLGKEGGLEPGTSMHIDWIMVPEGGSVKVRSASVWTAPIDSDDENPETSRFPSDHFAVIADLEVC